MTGQRGLSLALAALLALPLPGMAGSITTPEIVAKTTAAALACMQWMPIGTCFWLRCTLFGCSVNTSLKVGHYNPDLVISSYNELGGNPWTEIRATLGLAQKTAANGLLGSMIPACRCVQLISSLSPVMICGIGGRTRRPTSVPGIDPLRSPVA